MRLGYFRHKEMHVNLVNNKRHIILGRMKSESESGLVVSDYLWPSPWDSPGQNTGVGSTSLLQGIFPTQGSNPGLPHCRWILYCLSHKGSPRILEWVAYPFSSTSSRTGNQTGVSCTAGGCFFFLTNWAIREPGKNKQISVAEVDEVGGDEARVQQTIWYLAPTLCSECDLIWLGNDNDMTAF